MPNTPLAWVANGDINPSRFVKAAAAGEDFRVVQATLNAPIIGIAQEGTREAPIPSVTAANTLAAKDDDSLQVFGEGEACLLELGGAVNVGDRLKSDADGKGIVIVAGTTVQQVGAIAHQGGATGEKIRVVVAIFGETAS